MMCHQERILANVLGVQIAQQFLRIIMNRDILKGKNTKETSNLTFLSIAHYEINFFNGG